MDARALVHFVRRALRLPKNSFRKGARRIRKLRKLQKKWNKAYRRTMRQLLYARESRQPLRRLAGYLVLGGRLGVLTVRPRDKVKLWTASGVLAVRDLYGTPSRTSWALPLWSGGHSFSLRVDDLSEIEVLNEVFLRQEYSVQLHRDPEIILDLGSNIGASVHFFRGRYPNARIIAVEADPGTLVKLRANTGAWPNMEVHPVAVAGADGRRIFYPSRLSWASSLIGGSAVSPLAKNVESSSIEVTACSLDSLLDRLGVLSIDLLKIDIEGAEFEALEAFTAMSRVQTLVGEFHGDLNGRSLAELAPVFEGFDLEVRSGGGPPGRCWFTARRMAS